MSSIIKALDTLSEVTGKLTAFIVIPNVLALVYEVVARYVFKSPTIWSFEATYFLYGAHFLLGAAYTLKHHRHIRIEVFYSRRSERVQAIIDCLGYLILFIPVMLLMIQGGYGLVQEAITMGERSAASAWRPIMWPFKAVLPIGFILLLLQGIAEFARALPVALGRRVN